MAKNIGILGTGVVGRTIGAKLMTLGYGVTIGTRDVSKTMAKTERNQYGGPPYSEWHKQNPKITLGSFAEAAKFGEIIVNATNGGAAIEALRLAMPDNLKGKTVIDISNPLDFSKGMPPTLLPQYSNTTSLAEEIQKTFPDANIVKTLNIVNCEVMVNPKKSNGDPTMFVAGNSASAKDEAKSLLKQFGWSDIIDLGDIVGARGMEMLLPVWVRLWGVTQSGYFGFKVVR